MNDDQIQDLKDFITNVVRHEVSSEITSQTTILQQEFGTLKQDVGTIKQAVGRLEHGVDEIDIKLDTIADAVGVRLEEHEAELGNHKFRIAKLETATAPQ